jgi:D-alanyl-D-alanine carboxypeptidase/D-alanyl-D-alanine-endopeptidase (penicillin-binding protein 4)
LKRLGFIILALLMLTGTLFAAAPDQSLRPQYRPGSVLPDGADALLRRYARSGDLGYVVYDLTTGRTIEQRNAAQGFAPASVTKAITGLYALWHLGPEFRYKTRVMATGPIIEGTVQGDLILAGQGDPVLDTDDLVTLALAVKAAGVRNITGDYFYYADALPYFRDIDPDQPVHVGYNPAISGLNLNFNRVYFDWKRAGAGYRVQMDARSDQVRPVVSHITMRVAERDAPLFAFRQDGPQESWSVAKPALGQQGGRWLPVRDPALYTATVFASLARDNGITLPKPKRTTTQTARTTVAEITSAPMRVLVQFMLKYSNNMLAETLGLTVAKSTGQPVTSLRQSAGHMTRWAKQTLGMQNARFDDHSGLNDTSRVSPTDMVRALINGRTKFPEYAALLKPIKPRTAAGDLDKSGQASILAKTGTLNFVTALAGYLRDKNGANYVFAIFQQDIAARNAANTAQQETASGSRRWRGRAVNIQSGLLYRWARFTETD